MTKNVRSRITRAEFLRRYDKTEKEIQELKSKLKQKERDLEELQEMSAFGRIDD